MLITSVSNQFLFEVAGISALLTSDSNQIIEEISHYWTKFKSNRVPELKIHLTRLGTGKILKEHPQSIKWTPNGFHVCVWGMEVLYDSVSNEAILRLPQIGGTGDILRFFYSLYLVYKGGVLLHGNAIEKNGRVSIFSGPSESGKTTIARLRGERALLTDESVALLPQKGKTIAFSTPFFGELFYVTKNMQVPVEQIFYIFQAKEYRCRPMEKPEALKQFLHNIFQYFFEKNFCNAIFDNLSKMVNTFSSYRLEFLPEAYLWTFLKKELGYDL